MLNAFIESILILIPIVLACASTLLLATFVHSLIAQWDEWRFWFYFKLFGIKIKRSVAVNGNVYDLSIKTYEWKKDEIGKDMDKIVDVVTKHYRDAKYGFDGGKK